MKKLSQIVFWLLLLLFLSPVDLVQASSFTLPDPVVLCEEGVSLFMQERYDEAFPLLEAGFADRYNAFFANPDDLGICALSLGQLREHMGDIAGAEEALIVALNVFRTTDNHGYEARTLYDIGKFYSNQYRYSEALIAFQQAQKIAHEVDLGILECAVLNDIGIVYRDRGQYFQALEAFRLSLGCLRKIGNRAGEGVIINSIGDIYRNQGQLDDALEAYKQALGIAREVDDSAGEGNTLNHIGVVYQVQGRYTEALGFYQDALSIRRELGDRLGEGVTLHNIGTLYSDQNSDIEALEFLRQALKIHREVGDHNLESITLNIIGLIYFDQSLFVEALDAFVQSLDLKREVGDRAGEGAVLNNIGMVYYHQGLYAEALDNLHQALYVSIEVDDRRGQGTQFNNIGMVYHHQGRFTKAMEAYLQALEIAREVDDYPFEGVTLNNIGTLYDSLDRHNDALEAFQQALNIVQEMGDRYEEGRTYNNIAAVYKEQTLYSDAHEAYQNALKIAREENDLVGEGAVLNNIGMVYYHQGLYAEALDYLYQALEVNHDVGSQEGEGITLENIGINYQHQGNNSQAMKYYEEALMILESQRSVAGSEEGRSSFIAQFFDIYQRLTSLYFHNGQYDSAFFVSERSRARAFLDSIASGQVQLSDDDANILWLTERETYMNQQAAQEALAQEKLKNPPNNKLISDLESQLAVAKVDHQAILDGIEARSDQLASLVPGRSTVMTLPEVQALLGDHTTLVSFYILGESGTLAFLITHDGLKTVELTEATPKNLRTAIIDLRLWPTLGDPYPQPLQDLHTWLIAPLEAHLTTAQIGFIPHLLLHYVPFAALTDGQSYFGDQYTLFNLPSASSYKFIQQNTQTAHATFGQSALVFGNPDTGERALNPLLYSEKEAIVVAELLGVPVFTKSKANEKQFWQFADDAEIIHLAAHGEYNAANPLYSAIYLGTTGEQDGLLEVHEVYRLDLSATDLVVLSACDTNFGEVNTGDDVVGLTRAFIFAGTPTVISSLWNVDDEATALLMEYFYTYLQAGMGKAEALRQAQMDLREIYPSPYYWAAFVLTGDSGGITSEVLTPTDTSFPTSIVVDTETSVLAVTPTTTEGGGTFCGSSGLLLGVILLMGFGGLFWRSNCDSS